MNRSTLLRIGFAVPLLIAAAVSSSCSDSSESVENEELELKRPLRIYTYEEYLSEDLLKQFSEETGTEIEVVIYDNIDEMQQQIKSQPDQHDVLIIDHYSVEQLGNSRHLAPLISETLPNRVNISAEYLDKAFDKGNKYSYPYTWGTTLVAYRKDLVSNPEKSFRLLADPDLKGKVALLDERLDCYPFALRLINEDQNTKDADVIERATQKLLELEHTMDIQFLSDMETKEALKDGSIAAALLYSGDAALISDENENIGFFIPEEGATLWVDCFAISRDAINMNEAHQFINFMMDAKAAATTSNFLWYATPNKAAEPYLNAELKAVEAIYPKPDVLAKCDFQPENDNARERHMNEGWQRLKKAAKNHVDVVDADK